MCCHVLVVAYPHLPGHAPSERLPRMRSPVLLAVAFVLLAAGCGSEEPAAAPQPAPTTTTPSTLPPTSVAPAVTTEPTTPPPTSEPALPKLGTKQETQLGTATVYAVKFPVKAQDSTATSIRDKGMQFAVADIKVCANGQVNEDGYGFDASDFMLADSESRTYEFWNVQVGAKSPNLTDTVGFGSDTPRKGSCKRGWLTFQVPPKTKLTAVEYNSSGVPLVWLIR